MTEYFITTLTQAVENSLWPAASTYSPTRIMVVKTVSLWSPRGPMVEGVLLNQSPEGCSLVHKLVYTKLAEF